MAHVLQLTDGTATLTLTGGSYTLLDYTPIATDPSTAATVTISEDISLLVSGASTTAVQASIHAIEQMLTYAANRAEFGTGPRVYVQYQVSGDAATYRSEVVGGYVDVTPDAIKAWVGGKSEILLHIKRRGWWENVAPTTLVTASARTNNGSADTVLLGGGAITGALPAPAIVEITNTATSALYWDTFYLGANAFNDPAGFTGYLNSTGAAITWSAGAADSVMEAWSLNSTMLADTAGDYFRVVVAFADTSSGTSPQSDIYLRVRVKYGVTILARGGLVYTGPGVTKKVFDLGALPLPPGGYLTDNVPLTLEVTVTADAASSVNHYIDFVQLIPAGRGRFRRLEQIGYAVGLNDTLVDDPVTGLVYVKDYSDGNKRIPIVTQRGEPLMLWPGRACRITALFDESDADPYNPSRTYGLTVRYHPRRLSV